MEILVVMRDPRHAMMNRKLWSWVLGPETQKGSRKGGETGGIEQLRVTEGHKARTHPSLVF